ncbi:hypothetical protein [Guptibacillus algicola]|uniref:hypothetical protein n=1 Tax=Guptibacillus algicola TaxID=225844 RepID=UPI001CD36ED7|nr:hypothetical protein [Alkalihalobacillus algicola]MCA0987064.1 hypothetical protein [Alkalihalobacillus algicola]
MAILLPTVWLTLLFVLYIYQKQFNKELELLPAEEQIGIIMTHPMVGESIQHKLVDTFDASHSIVLIASERCNYCASEIEELLIENKTTQLPIIVGVVDDEKEAGAKSKYKQYEEAVTLTEIEEETLVELNIHQYPTLLLVDDKGIVLEESGWNRALFLHYEKLKGGERYVE